MTMKLGYRDVGKTSEEGINRISSRLISCAGVMRDNDLLVTATGTPDNHVNVATGDIVIGNNSPNTADPDYYYQGWNTASAAFTITANASGNPRIDVVVAYVDLSVQSAASNDNPGALVCKVVAGTAAATPVPPADAAIQTSVGASNPWVLLAQVAVANGFSSISSGNITDLRPLASTPGTLSNYLMQDAVGKGLLWSQSTGLIGQMTTGFAVIDGEFVNKSYFTHTFTASKDTYVDLPKASKPTSVDDLTFTPVTNGASAPVLAASSIRLAKVVTNGSAITSSVTSGLDSNNVPIRRIGGALLNDSDVTAAKIAADAVTATKLDWATTGADGGIWWEEISRTTLGAAATNITVSGIPNRKYLKIIAYFAAAGTLDIYLQFNADTGANYAWRHFNSVLTATPSASTTSMVFTASGGNASRLATAEIVNIATQEKLLHGEVTETGTTGAANVPSKALFSGKWVNTTDPISSIKFVDNGANTLRFDTGTEIIILGHN